MGIFSRSKRQSEGPGPSTPISTTKDDPPPAYHNPRPTGLRLLTAISYLLATVFLILVEIGNINNKAVIRSTWFLQINLANIIPASVPNAVFINSIAQSIGLHDFYQVGLWDFCEGYNGQGITHCSHPTSLYWFNPVEIILNELLAGASITLPTEIVNILNLVKLASAWMFSCFLVGTVLTFLCIFLTPLGFSQKPRWEHKARRVFFRQFPITLLSFGALLFTAAGSVIATVMFVIFQQKVSTAAADLNIEAYLGRPMLAFMWTATGFNLIGFLMQIGTCCGVCCCTGRRKAERRSRRANAPNMSEKQSAASSRSPGSFGFRRRGK
ncbi:SUR7/PalI family-domain-containing protein [Exophiala viscosa]|uniref:SUR7/PalI family-domain-containing protein n=1 Tax=Exophiala viscosa TaxID=2486360 RepID=UPI00219554EE|nr:SUR7/PalI family-domain-containing protein [Exophiala viscosa]